MKASSSFAALLTVLSHKQNQIKAVAILFWAIAIFSTFIWLDCLPFVTARYFVGKNISSSILNAVSPPSATFVVTTSSDNGDDLNPTPGSLREALIRANESPGADLITFESDCMSINPKSALPVITDPVTIDAIGVSHAIELVGSVASASTQTDGLRISASGSVLRGMQIKNFSGAGVRVSGASNCSIEANTIRLNGKGVVISSGEQNRITVNSIYSNSVVGIDLGDDGVSANDTNDVDVGPNGLQNFPTLTVVNSIEGNTVIQGTLNSSPNKTYILEFFSSDADPSDVRSGRTYLGSITTVTDNTGNASFTASGLPGGSVRADESVSATATQTDTSNTSEFSPLVSVSCFARPTASSPVIAAAGVPTAFSISVSDACGGTVSYNWDFGDGAAASSQNPSHTYTAAGIYNWHVTITVSGLGASTQSGSIIITDIKPTISSLSPMGARADTVVTITGTNLSDTSVVMFNGLNAIFTIDSASQIMATVPQGATTGPVVVQTQAGVATSPSNFIVGTAVITVNSAADADARDHKVTLREAILIANGTLAIDSLKPQERAQVKGEPSDHSLDTIWFNIESGARTISPASALPAITDAVVIDGTTQPGYTALPIIELNGADAGPNVNGLTISAGSSTVRRLVINRFSGSGVLLQENDGNLVAGNFIGTSFDGNSAAGEPHLSGITIFSDNNVIGGTLPEAINIISCNNIGIAIFGSENKVQGNYIGLGKDGVPVGNIEDGIFISGSNNTIGARLNLDGTPVGSGNVIRYNLNGVFVRSGNSGNSILLNEIYLNEKHQIFIAQQPPPSPSDPCSSGPQEPPEDTNATAPVISSAIYDTSTGKLTIIGAFRGTPSTSYYLNFYRFNSCSEGSPTSSLQNISTVPILRTTDNNGSGVLNTTIALPTTTGYVNAQVTAVNGQSLPYSDCQIVEAGCSLTCEATPTLNPKAGESVQFNGSAAATCPGTPTYDWDFGDGTDHSSLQSPSHTYSQAGSFNWSLTVSASGAPLCTKSGTINVSPACTLICSASVPASATAGEAVSFTSTATASNCSGQLSFSWSFGDGGSSSQQNPSHSFSQPGTYDWHLTANVSGASPCTQSGSILVESPPPIVRTLTVASSPVSGVSVAVSPADNDGMASGVTQFTRSYDNNTSVTLDAPASASGSAFIKWQRGGADYSFSPSTFLIMDSDYTMTALYQSAPAECTLTPISRGQVINAELSATDCRSLIRGNSFNADTYTFSGARHQQLKLTLSSAAFDTYLYLIGPDAAVVDEDDNSAGGSNSKIPALSGSLLLPADGTYTIQVTSFSSNAVGGYSLSYVSVDADGDSIPDLVEGAEGRNPLAKDNDVFGSNRLFVMQQYRDFLAREADPDGITYWTGVMGQGVSRAQVIDNFFNSAEFQGAIAPIARLYFSYFLRIPDYGGVLFWSDAFRNGQPLHVISENFALSSEFQQRYGSLSNTQFITLVYENVLGRTPSQVEIDFWVGDLDAGRATRGQVMMGFSESEEFKAKMYNEVYVTMMYAGMLRRGLAQVELDYWLELMDDGISGLQLIENFLPQPEYHDRFLPPQ